MMLTSGISKRCTAFSCESGKISVKKPLTILLIAIITLATLPAHAQRKAKGGSPQTAIMLAQPCMGCHGAKGLSVTSPMPIIGGQNEAYLQNTLRAYRDETRPGTIMPRLMKGYNDHEINGLASFFTKQKWQPGAQNVDEATAQRGKRLYQRMCKDCHINDGRETAESEYPVLAGQWLPYLQTVAEKIASGEHKVDSKLKSKIDELTAQEINAILHFFASRQ